MAEEMGRQNQRKPKDDNEAMGRAFVAALWAVLMLVPLSIDLLMLPVTIPHDIIADPDEE
jgi:hypothetical protein